MDANKELTNLRGELSNATLRANWIQELLANVYSILGVSSNPPSSTTNVPVASTNGLDLEVNISSQSTNSGISYGNNYPVFDTVVTDAFSSYNTNTGQWTCPAGQGGVYLCTFLMRIDLSNATGGEDGAGFAVVGNTIGSKRIIGSPLSTWGGGYAYYAYGSTPIYIPDHEVVQVNIWSYIVMGPYEPSLRLPTQPGRW